MEVSKKHLMCPEENEDEKFFVTFAHALRKSLPVSCIFTGKQQ